MVRTQRQCVQEYGVESLIVVDYCHRCSRIDVIRQPGTYISRPQKESAHGSLPWAA